MKDSIFLLALFFSILLLIFSCKSKQKNNLEKKYQATQQQAFSKFLQGGHSNVYENKQMLIKSAEELVSVYKELNSSRTPNLDIPKIDFKKELVLALFMGSKSSGGYSIAINKITETDAALVVYYKETAPSGMTTAVMTQPFYLASISSTTKPIRFIKE